MQVMIVEEDATLRTRITGALAPEGVNVLSFGRLGPAKEAARRANVDILVLGESIEGRLASDVALLAEWRNPRLGSILLSDRESDAAEELFDLIPSLQAVLARGTGPRTLARLAIATARSQEGIVLLQDDQWTAGPAEADWVTSEEGDGPAFAVPVTEAPAPVRERAFAPVEAVTLGEDEPAPVREALAPLRERLVQAQERLAALEMPAPAQELPTRRRAETEPPPGLFYVLPSFLRDAEDMTGAQDDDLPPETPHPAMLPVQAAPRRRLHLA
jgi:hypothetical protein